MIKGTAESRRVGLKEASLTVAEKETKEILGWRSQGSIEIGTEDPSDLKNPRQVRLEVVKKAS